MTKASFLLLLVVTRYPLIDYIAIFLILAFKLKQREKKSLLLHHIVSHLQSICRNCNLLKNNVVIDNEITSKIKMAHKILMEHIKVLLKNKASSNVITIIDSLPTDTVSKPNNTNDEICDKFLAEFMLKLMCNY